MTGVVAPRARLAINGRETIVEGVSEIRQALSEISSDGLSEVWISDPDDDARALSVLTHGDVGWQMYLRCNGDAGFSSRNPDYDGSPEVMLTYRLSNGQVDKYPASWAVPRHEGFRAVEHFFVTRERAPWITWHEDSNGLDMCMCAPLSGNDRGTPR